MRFLLAALLALTLAQPVRADGVEVDVELLLLVDVSRSMTPRELEIQRRGYAEALTTERVHNAIQAGLLQRVALAYVEWAGAGSQRVIVDWRLVSTRADLAAFADVLTTSFDPSLRRTSISSALRYGRDSLAANAYDGLRRIIDISGDGPNNSGGPVLDARDAVLAEGIVVNGLPLMTREGMGSQWHLDDLDEYYRNCVTGGPGSFVIPVLDWEDFAMAVRRKLVLELADLSPLRPLGVQADAGYDCLIGEKIWRRNRGDWMLP